METINKICKIILVDDQKMFRDSLRLVIENEKIGTVIGEAASGEEFLGLLRYEIPDVVLLDIDAFLVKGVSVTKKALDLNPGIKIIALSMFDDEKNYTAMLRAGARGFVLKKSGLDELLKGIQEVAAGGYYFSIEVLRKMVISNGRQEFELSKIPEYSITKRELEILQFLAGGYSSTEIAAKINLSPKTIDSYRSRLITKTKTKNSVELVIYALKNGLISID